MAFQARYGGFCHRCRGQIVPGQYIESGGVRFVHTVCPTAVVAEAPVVTVTEPGFYFKDDAIYRVQRGRDSGNLYALILHVDLKTQKGKFEYLPGLIYKLSPEQRLTREQAAEFGHAYGLCGMCGATLTDPASVARGIGPQCATRLAWTA